MADGAVRTSGRERGARGARAKLLSGLLVVGLLLGSGALSGTFMLACNGSLDTFPTLAAAQRDLKPAPAAAAPAATQPDGSGTEPATLLGQLREIPRSVG